MKLLVAFLVVGLLEQNIGADSRVVELFVVFNGSSGDIYVYAADGAVFVLDRIDCVDALEDVFDRVIDGILARLDREALVSHILKRDHLCLDLLLG